jgi:hypothetical protein
MRWRLIRQSEPQHQPTFRFAQRPNFTLQMLHKLLSLYTVHTCNSHILKHMWIVCKNFHIHNCFEWNYNVMDVRITSSIAINQYMHCKAWTKMKKRTPMNSTINALVAFYWKKLHQNFHPKPILHINVLQAFV